MADTPEGRVKKKIKAVLKNHNAQMYGFWPVPSGYGASTLDFIGCHRGHFFAIEAKAPGEDPTPRQRDCIKQMREAGGTVFLIDDLRAGQFGEDLFHSLDELDAWLLLH